MLAKYENLQAEIEELRSANSDLVNENAALQEKVSEVVNLNTDMDNLLRSTEIGTIFLDTKMQVRRFTPAIREQFKLKETDIGKPINEFESILGDNDLIQNAQKVIKTGQVHRKELQSRDGKWFLKQIFPFVDSYKTIQGAVITFVNITELKSYEHALKNRITEINEQNTQLENLKNAMLNITEDLNEEKLKLTSSQEFLAKMSHEIRTPLNAIIGMSHLLYDTAPTAIQQEYLTILKSSSDILQALISGILDYSKIESGQIEVKKKEFDLKGLLKTLHRTFQLKMEDQPVKIEMDLDDSINNLIIGDDLLLNQILINLLSNATKFTHKGSIDLRVELLEREGNNLQIRFTVQDTGVGIPREHLKTIFEKFKQADNEFQIKYRGTGLGLAITKQLVEIQGGSINVESTVDKGSIFSFILSYEDSGRKLEEIPKELPAVSNIKLSNHYVLVAEDNFMNRKYISTLLNKWGVTFKMAHNGKEALEFAKKEKFSLVIMDVVMPMMNGYVATIAIRNTALLNQDTPIVALSASAVYSEKEKAFEAGMTDYLPKPYKPIQLLQIIRKYNQDTENQPEKNIKDLTFEYNPKLDVDFLNECYEGDLSYSIDMFDTFLTYSIVELNGLRPFIESRKWKEACALTHKLKPTFSMVGLTMIEGKMLKLKKAMDNEEEENKIISLLEDVEVSIKDSLPLIKKELIRMENYLRDNN